MPRVILCIDDDQQVLQDLEAALSGEDCHLIHCSAPEEALRIVRKQSPDLVVIEIRLEQGIYWEKVRICIRTI